MENVRVITQANNHSCPSGQQRFLALTFSQFLKTYEQTDSTTN